MDFGHFERMPVELYSICSEVNDIGRAEDCDLVTNWHVNYEGFIDSGVGIMQGQKIQLKSFMQIQNPVHGGQIKITYKTQGFRKDAE
jgi:hypothetical protein